jgi:hypothetical protein
MTMISLRQCAAVMLAAAAIGAAPARGDTPNQILERYVAQSGVAPSPAKGRQFFVGTHGREWSCGTCHGEVPVQTGAHAVTKKPIAPLAPAADRARFVDPAKSDKWFRRNCNDVLGRECSPAEKADVLSWLLTLAP